MDEEIERRRAAVEFAIGSVGLSGYVLGEEIKQEFGLYVLGSMTCEQLRANCLARYKNSLRRT